MTSKPKYFETLPGADRAFLERHLISIKAATDAVRLCEMLLWRHGLKDPELKVSAEGPIRAVLWLATEALETAVETINVQGGVDIYDFAYSPFKESEEMP